MLLMILSILQFNNNKYQIFLYLFNKILIKFYYTLEIFSQYIIVSWYIWVRKQWPREIVTTSCYFKEDILPEELVLREKKKLLLHFDTNEFSFSPSS